jgi:hypothetical protein
MPDHGSKYGWLWHAAPILLLAGIIRFYAFGDVQLTNDELSAWSRLQFDSLSDLLKFGVEPDGHPALTHLFLWFWTGVFGDATWVLKLPFVLMSLGAIAMLYHLAYAAFGKNTANSTGVMLAACQMFPVFALQARPYAMGMLICSALAWIWYKVTILKNQGWRIHIWFGVLLALSVYDHYFSGLLAMVVWASGWLYHENLDKKRYLASAFIGAVLFLPHIPITLTQLGYKGIGGWLRTPDRTFLWEWIQGLFNYHTITLVLAGLLLLAGLGFHFRKSEKAFWKLLLVLAFWFFVVFAVGYAYSVLVDPLLHHGSLIFAAPFLVMAFASIVAPNGLAGRFTAWALAVPLLFSLVFTRNHYEILKTQPYATVMEKLEGLQQRDGNAMAIISQTASYLEYYGDPQGMGFPVLNRAVDSSATGEMVSRLVSAQPEVFFTDGRTPSLSLAATLMYNQVEIIEGYTFTGLTFSNGTEPDTPYAVLASSRDSIKTSDEFVPMYKSEPDMPGFTFADEVGGLVQFAERPVEDVFVVVVFSKGEETVHWTAGSLSENGFEWNGQTVLPHQILLWNTFVSEREMRAIQANVYIWNPQKTLLKINRWKAVKMEGNPNRYSQLLRRP